MEIDKKNIEAIVFPCTYKCDAKCVMCSIHKRERPQELSVEQIDRFFARDEISSIKSINITGGEPTLRADLVEIFEVIIKRCTQLKEILLNSNGLNTSNILKQIECICQVVPKQINFSVYISLDSMGEDNDLIRGVKNATERVKDTLLNLKELSKEYGFNIIISCTVTSYNVEKLEEVLQYAKDNDLYIEFIISTLNSAYINSSDTDQKFVIPSDKYDNLIKFLYDALAYEKNVMDRILIERFENRLNKKKCINECIFREGKGLLLEADGIIRACGMTGDVQLGHVNEDIDWEKLGQYDKYCSICNTDSYYSFTTSGKYNNAKRLLEKVRELRG